MPEGTSEKELEEIFTSADMACKKIGVSIVGGHTEITPGLSRPIVMCTSFCFARNYIASTMANAGESILMTKAAALEGTSILAGLENIKNVVGAKQAKKAESFMSELSIVDEAVEAASTGYVSAMHDCTEGGVLGAVFEMAEASGLGFVLYRENVPLRRETVEICRILNIDPLKLISSGSLLISTSHPEDVSKKLSKICECAVIGRFTKEDRILVENGRKKVIREPPQDELWRVLSRA